MSDSQTADENERAVPETLIEDDLLECIRSKLATAEYSRLMEAIAKTSQAKDDAVDGRKKALATCKKTKKLLTSVRSDLQEFAHLYDFSRSQENDLWQNIDFLQSLVDEKENTIAELTGRLTATHTQRGRPVKTMERLRKSKRRLRAKVDALSRDKDRLQAELDGTLSADRSEVAESTSEISISMRSLHLG